jgi:glycosyltransferase involved in cell wall biosynthesis
VRICILGDAEGVHIRRLASGLADRGQSVRVLSHKTCEIPGVKVERFRVPRFGLRYPARWRRRWSMYLTRLMQGHDIVHVNFLHDWGITRETAGAGRLVVSPWGSDIVKPPDLRAYPEELAQRRRELLRMADAVTVWGRYFAAKAAEFADLPAEAVSIVPLGVDLEQFRPAGVKRNDPPTIGFFKGFNPVYGPKVLVRAIPRVLARFPRVRFDMVGDGKLLDECRQLVQSLGVTHAVRWIDRQPHDRLPVIIGRWDLSVIPSICESFGVAALESSAMEVPVVASRVGGLPETVRDGQTGLLVPPSDSEALANALVELLSDEPRRREMGTAGRRMVAEEYEWQSCLERWEAVYRGVLLNRVPRTADKLSRLDTVGVSR